uniref:Uncharacterized protein n=1 Tax=Micrurus surinamensis TaxID=129470 RepID=A0A2D4PNG5_MICSU
MMKLHQKANYLEVIGELGSLSLSFSLEFFRQGLDSNYERCLIFQYLLGQRSPNPSLLDPAPVCGMRDRANKRSPTGCRQHAKPRPLSSAKKISLHRTGPWCPKGWGPLF